MSRIKFVLLLSLVVLTLGAHELLASTGTTYVAGTCKPSLPSYATISAALAATPPPTTVLVCPQTFNEQVTITQPVTLQGISSGDSAQPILAPPGGGLTQSATNSFGTLVYYQLWVNNVTGPVNISNITVDGTGNAVSCSGTSLAGIYYQNSPGTVNRVTTRNQTGNGCGVGISLEGGASNPLVTVQNSSIHEFDNTGIVAGTNSGPSALTASIKTNSVNANGALISIYAQQGATSTISGNSLFNGGAGVWSNPGAAGSISGNTITNISDIGILVQGDGLSVTSNKITNSNPAGIYIASAVATIQGNTITESTYGIYFGCTANPNVRSNTLSDDTYGVAAVPQSVITSNTYYNVATIRNGGC